MSSWSVHHYASSPVWDMFDLPVVSNFLRRQYREHVFSGLSAVRLFTAVCGEGVMATLNEISERVGVLQNTVSSLLDNPLVSAMKKTRRRVLCTCGWIGYHNMFHFRLRYWMLALPQKNCKTHILLICGKLLYKSHLNAIRFIPRTEFWDTVTL